MILHCEYLGTVLRNICLPVLLGGQGCCFLLEPLHITPIDFCRVSVPFHEMSIPAFQQICLLWLDFHGLIRYTPNGELTQIANWQRTGCFPVLGTWQPYCFVVVYLTTGNSSALSPVFSSVEFLSGEIIIGWRFRNSWKGVGAMDRCPQLHRVVTQASFAQEAG